MTDPTPLSSQAPPPSNAQGSVALGFGVAWAIVVAGYFVVAVLIAAISGTSASGAFFSSPVLSLLLGVAPWLACVFAMIRLSSRNQHKTVKGMALGLASIVGVAVLLAAACFGLLTMSIGPR